MDMFIIIRINSISNCIITSIILQRHTRLQRVNISPEMVTEVLILSHGGLVAVRCKIQKHHGVVTEDIESTLKPVHPKLSHSELVVQRYVYNLIRQLAEKLLSYTAPQARDLPAIAFTFSVLEFMYHNSQIHQFIPT